MPEGPEVETVVRTLEKQIKGNQIVSSTIYYPRIVETDNFNELVLNKRFTSFNRQGKFLVLGLDTGYLVIHLRMEGKFYIDLNPLIDKHIHLMFKLDDGRYLKYHDTRKFGRIAYVDDYKEHPGIKKLGLDVLDDRCTGAYLKEKLKTRLIPIKQVLLDQSVVAGIGNIYANEILFEARVHPNQPANSISTRKINEIVRCAKEVLSLAIEMGGTTIRSYTSSLNVHGRFDQKLNVHTKDMCPRCDDKIKKIFVNKRGTYYCARCQRLKK